MRLGLSLSLGAGSANSEPAAPFDPATLFDGDAGAWYDFNAADTMWQDTSATTAAEADSAVARVDPSAGTFTNIQQGTGAAQPIMRNDGTYNYLEFDQADDVLATASGQAFDTGGLCTIIMALKANGPSRAANLAVYGTATSNNAFGLNTTADIGTFSPVSVSRGTALSTATAADQGTSPLVLTMQGDVANDINVLRINGAQAATDATDQGTANDTARSFSMGKTFVHSINADVYGVLIIGRLLSAGEISNMETLLAERIGVVLA